MQAAGWFVDPGDPGQLRYWDGQQWTSYTYPRLPGASAPGAPPPWLGYGYPMHPPRAVAPKNPALSLIVSFFLPGVGSMINGDVGIGVVILLIWLISIPLMFFFIGFFTATGAWILGLVDAYQGARRWNARHGIIS
jgi:TM2 domain-containing membrane protein YozV